MSKMNFEYKIYSFTWNGVWSTKTVGSTISPQNFQFTFHGETYYGYLPVTVYSGYKLRFYSDRIHCYNASDVYVGGNGYYSSNPGGSPYNFGTLTDDEIENQYDTQILQNIDAYYLQAQPKTQLENCKLKLEANAAGELTFTVPAAHDAIANHETRLVPMNSLIIVYEWDYITNPILWQGRLTSKTLNLDGSIDCAVEGLMACLNDGFVRPYTLTMRPDDFSKFIVRQHYQTISGGTWNQSDPSPTSEVRVYPFKRWFNFGDFTDFLGYGNQFRSDTEYATTQATLKESILDAYGGFLWLNYYGDAYLYAPRLNWKKSIENYDIYGNLIVHNVKFAVNMCDYSIDKDCSDYFTHLLPLGKLADDVSFSGRFKLTYDATTRPLVSSDGTIELRKVNGVTWAEPVRMAGKIIQVQSFDDCDTQDELYSAAVAYIQSLNYDWSYEISAVDMNIIDSTQQDKPIHIGDTLAVWLPGNTSQTASFQAVVLGINLDINKPWETTYTIGNFNNKLVTRGLI